MSWVWWVALICLPVGLALISAGMRWLDRTPEALDFERPVTCGDCGDRFAIDEIELHYLLRHPETEEAQHDPPP